MPSDDIVWDMRLLWHNRLDALINALTDAAIRGEVEGFYRCLNQLYSNSFFRIKKYLDIKEFENGIKNVRELVYNKEYFNKNDRYSLEKKEAAFNKAYMELEILQKTLFTAIDDAGLFMKRYKETKPFTKFGRAAGLSEEPDEPGE